MYFMAKTIMISNAVYEELKMRKSEKSFSELITDLLSSKKIKIGGGLRSCFGLLKNDKEFVAVEKSLERGWKGWNKKYV